MPKFDGTSTKADFESYKTKHMAVEALKDGFHKAYVKNRPVNKPGATTPDPNLIANEKLRAMAIAYLILIIKEASQDLIKPVKDDPYLAWQLLTARYQPSTIDEYARLRKEMKSYELDDPYDSPELLINKILRTNARLIAVKPTYGQDDVQIMAMVHASSQKTCMRYSSPTSSSKCTPA